MMGIVFGISWGEGPVTQLSTGILRWDDRSGDSRWDSPSSQTCHHGWIDHMLIGGEIFSCDLRDAIRDKITNCDLHKIDRRNQPQVYHLFQTKTARIIPMNYIR